MATKASKQVVPGTQVFKYKCKLDGTLQKHKARWCVRGYVWQLKDDGNIRTYSPVISWVTVRLMMIVGLLCSFKAFQIDFSNAFAQLKELACLQLLQGYNVHSDNFMLDSHKNLCGQVESLCIDPERLKCGPKHRNFVTSDLDLCLFVSNNKRD